MKKKIRLGILAAFLLMTTACSQQITEEKPERVVPVEVVRVTGEERVPVSSFIGTVQPGKTVQLSFKIGGRIENITVEKGDAVRKGQVIAVLEKSDLIYAENLAKTQLEMVQAQYEKASNGATPEDIEQARLNRVKASDAYQYAVDRFAEVEALYAAGTASKQVYDQAELEKNIRYSDLKLAEEVEAQVLKGARYEEIKALTAQLDSARTEYEYRQSQLEEATLRSSIQGTVMEVLGVKGEIIGAGYPVVVLRDEDKLVYVGVPEKELKTITANTTATLEKDGQKIEAEVSRIAEIPDSLTGLYNVELTAEKLEIPFGATVTVHFPKPSEKGFYIPLSAVLNDGQDYVYVVDEDKALRKNITILGTDDFEVRVSGLSEGDFLIVSGAGRVSTGESVMVKED